MGRPNKTKVSETSAAAIAAVVARVAKKIKSFTRETLTQAVYKSFQKTVDSAELSTMDASVSSYMVNEKSKYNINGDVYTVIPGVRGRPKKVAAVEVAAAV